MRQSQRRDVGSIVHEKNTGKTLHTVQEISSGVAINAGLYFPWKVSTINKQVSRGNYRNIYQFPLL